MITITNYYNNNNNKNNKNNNNNNYNNNKVAMDKKLYFMCGPVCDNFVYCCVQSEKKLVCSPECHSNAVCLPENICLCQSQYVGDGLNCTGGLESLFNSFITHNPVS